MEGLVRAHVFVSGKVQGVFFRKTAKNKAQKLKLKGWIKNLPDSRVETVIEGPLELVKEMIQWLKKGPLLAKVEKTDIFWEPYKGKYKDFEIRYD